MEDLCPFNEPDYVADPYPYWRRLRDEAPVYWSRSTRFWAITRYDDAVRVLHDPAAFSSRGGATGRNAEIGVPRLTMIEDDPPHHDRLRRILSKAFVPRTTLQREPRIRAIARELFDGVRARIAAGEAVDLVREFSSPFPVRVIGEILGIPRELHDRMRLWNAATSVTGAAGSDVESPPNAIQEMHEALGELVEARRRDRRDDLFSALIAASEDDESPLRSEELVGLCLLLWIAGNETTTNLLSNSAVVLHEDPDLTRLVRERPDRLPAIVEELLRLHTPINCLARTAARDVEMHGEKIREGDVAMVIFAAANRDPRHFDRPDAFDPERRPNDHIAFSHGIHYCLGSHLARLEARIGLELFAELLPAARVRTEAGSRIPFGMLRGWLSLPLERAAD